MSTIEHIKITVGKRTGYDGYTPYLKIKIDYTNGLTHTKEGYTVSGQGYYKLGNSLAKFFNEYLRDELENATSSQRQKLIEKGSADEDKWIMDNLHVEDLEILGAKVEKSYARGNDIYDIYFPSNMKGYKTAIYGKNKPKNILGQLENAYKRML